MQSYYEHSRDFIVFIIERLHNKQTQLNSTTLCKLLNWDHRACS